MNLSECKQTLFSVMAETDGDMPLLSAEQTARHLTGCESCRTEIERYKSTVNLLQKQKRRTEDIDLWSLIEKRIEAKPISKSAAAPRYFFFLLGAVLIVYKLLEMIPARDLGFFFKFAPLAAAAALFYFFKENPFKINTELKLEG